MLVAALLASALAAASLPDSTAIPTGPRFASLQGGEPLGAGGAQAAFSAGFSTLSAEYAQAASDGSDLGAMAEVDWLTTEAFLGPTFRYLTWRFGETFVSWRARAGLYADGGATWAAADNRAALGVQIAPGLAASRRLSRVIVSAALDGRFDVTFARGGGQALGVKGSLALETPLWGDLLAGARLGLGGLWSFNDAPFANDSPRALVELEGLLTYRLF